MTFGFCAHACVDCKHRKRGRQMRRQMQAANTKHDESRRRADWRVHQCSALRSCLKQLLIASLCVCILWTQSYLCTCIIQMTLLCIHTFSRYSYNWFRNTGVMQIYKISLSDWVRFIYFVVIITASRNLRFLKSYFHIWSLAFTFSSL